MLKKLPAPDPLDTDKLRELRRRLETAVYQQRHNLRDCEEILAELEQILSGERDQDEMSF